MCVEDLKIDLMKNSANKIWLFWTTLNHIVGLYCLYILDSFGPFHTILFVSLVPNYHMYLSTFHSEMYFFWDTLYLELPSSWHFWGGQFWYKQFWYSLFKDKRIRNKNVAHGSEAIVEWKIRWNLADLDFGRNPIRTNKSSPPLFCELGGYLGRMKY